MAHDVPLGCAPDEYDDLISGTCSHLPKRAPADGTPFNSGSPDIPGELSEREFQILQLIAEGQMNKEIARSLAISAETVKWHIKNIYAKLKVNSRTQAMSRALEMKLLD
ncbi:response regulator transcription factor [Klebsiella pneumoniae]